MKFTLAAKSLAAAVGLAFATQASAVFEAPFTGNGSLVFSAWDVTSTAGDSRTFTQTLNVLMNDFLPNVVGPLPGDNPSPGNKTPDGGIVIPFALDPLFNQTFGSVAPTNLRWNIFAGDSVNEQALPGSGLLRMLTTTGTGLPPTGSNAALNTASQNGDTYILTLVGSYNCGSADACNDAPFGFLGFAGDQNTWGTRYGQALPVGNNNAVTGYTSTNFYYVQQNGLLDPTPFTVIPFGNAAGLATWTLAQDGTLTYALAPVPEPGTWAMLLAGLLGLFAIARRRVG
jgi:hypothetical protein